MWEESRFVFESILIQGRTFNQPGREETRLEEREGCTNRPERRVNDDD